MTIRPLHDRILVKRLEEETKTAGGLFIPDTAKEKPIQAKVWHFEPCVFDEPEDTDPEYEDEDVGTEKWAIGESWLAADQTLKKELARRTKVRRELDRGGEEYDEEGEDEGDGRAPRGRGRGPSRGGPRRDWGTQARGGGGGRPRGGMDDVPDGMFDPDWTPPEPPPDMNLRTAPLRN